MFGKEKKPTREERVAEKIRARVTVQLEAHGGQLAQAIELREKHAKAFRAAMGGDLDALARYYNPKEEWEVRRADAHFAAFERALRTSWAWANKDVQAEDDKEELDRLAAAARVKAEAELKEQRRQAYLKRKAEDSEFEAGA